jgi:hypothetical protein
MADEIDTTAAPEPSGQTPEPTSAEPEIVTQSGWREEPEPTPEPSPEVTPEPTPEPVTLTPDQIMEQASERAFQKMASWQGRRDKDLFDSLGNLIDTRLRTVTPPSPTQPSTDPATMLENPDAWAETVIPRIMDKVQAQRSKADQEYMGNFIREAGSLMDSDPLYQGDEGQKLGAEVIAEVQKNIGKLDRRFPPADAARLWVANSTLNVVRQRTNVKQNALAGNRPSTGPMGTITPPAQKALKAKPIKLSDEAAALAKRWNYSHEDIAKVFGA